MYWGNGEAVTELLEKIAYRDGIGDVLADGILAAIEHFGSESAPYAIHIKGNDMPPNELRSAHTYNMRYAVASRGAIICKLLELVGLRENSRGILMTYHQKNQ